MSEQICAVDFGRQKGGRCSRKVWRPEFRLLLFAIAVYPATTAALSQRFQDEGIASFNSSPNLADASDPCGTFTMPPLAATRVDQSGGMGNDVEKPGPSQTGIRVNISPHTDKYVRLAAGYSMKLAATVTGTTKTAIAWSVVGAGCSGFECGNIVGSVYFAPTRVSHPRIVTLRAISEVDQTASDSIRVCVIQPGAPWNNLSSERVIQTAATRAGHEAVMKIPKDVEILSDTKGMDFASYMQSVVHNIKRNWYSVIPSSARKPTLKRGTVRIEFAITKNGTIEGLHYSSSSGDAELDRACYIGVSDSSPLPPLPPDFKGQDVRVRMTFRYNEKEEEEVPRCKMPAWQKAAHP